MRQKEQSLKENNKSHYGWIIVLAGMAVVFSCLGLGRFSLGMLLPSMGTSLNLNYSQMGLVSHWFLKSTRGRAAGIMLSGNGFAIVFTISYVLVAADLPNPFLYASIGIFGLAVWSIPTIMSAAVGDYTGPVRAVKAFGFITLFFGVGQITGPAVAGFTADITGTFSMAFWLCAVLTASAVLLTYFLRPPSRF
jgi:MFS family permease